MIKKIVSWCVKGFVGLFVLMFVLSIMNESKPKTETDVKEDRVLAQCVVDNYKDRAYLKEVAYAYFEMSLADYSIGEESVGSNAKNVLSIIEYKKYKIKVSDELKRKFKATYVECGYNKTISSNQVNEVGDILAKMIK